MQFSTLPNDALRTILNHLSPASLAALSCTARRFKDLATPVIFKRLDLTLVDAEELSEISRDLFEGHEARLKDVHLESLSMRLDSDYLAANLPILNAVKSADMLKLEIDVHEDDEEAQEKMELATRFLQDMQDLMFQKFGSISLYVDQNESCEEEDEPQTHIEINISYLLEAIPKCLLKKLSIAGGNDKRSNAHQMAMNKHIGEATFLESLTLTNSSLVTTSWWPAHLKKLHVSYLDQEHFVMHSLFRMLTASSRTLNHLVVRDMAGLPLPTIMMASKIKLPSLKHLELADAHAAKGSLLSTFLETCTMDALNYLDLDLVDMMKEDLSYLPKVLPNLKGLHLGEGMMLCWPEDEEDEQALTTHAQAFEDTATEFRSRSIELKVTMTTSRIDDPSEALLVGKRLAILANNIVHLSIGVSKSVAGHLAQGLVKAHFPVLKNLYLAIFNDQEQDASEEMMLNPGLAANTLSAFCAPALSNLHLSLSISDKLLQIPAVLDLLNAKRPFPIMDCDGMGVMEGIDATAEHEASTASVILTLTDESTKIRFVSKEYDEDEDEDDFEDEEDEIELHSDPSTDNEQAQTSESGDDATLYDDDSASKSSLASLGRKMKEEL